MQLILFFLLTILFSSYSYAETLTTFVVQEALRGDETGWARTQETVTVGLPLPEHASITETTSFGLTGANAGQFKITGWWPNGNAKWVTVDLQTDLSPRQVKENFSLNTDGGGNFGGSDLATDNGETISVNTGVAQFTIKKTNFNIFDIVTVSGATIVSTGNSGGFEIVDTSSNLYSSNLDSSSSAYIEDNGPVKAVIIASGSFKNASDERFCDYELQMTFYKGKSHVKVIASLRNALFADYQDSKIFLSSQLKVPLTIGGGKTVLLTDNTSEITRSLADVDTAYVYQGRSSHPLQVVMETTENWTPPIPKSGGNPWVFDPNFQGVSLVAGAENIQTLGNATTWTQGYADLSDSTGKGLTVAMKYMPQNYPAGFDIKGNGDVSIELFSKRNNNTECKLGWSKWESREVLWDFHLNSNNPNESFHTLQHPLIARAPFEYYRQNKAFNTDELVTTEEEIQYYNAVGETPADFSDPTYTTNTTAVPWRGYFRVWARAVGGDTNFIDTPPTDLIDWIRTGKAGYYVFAQQRLFFDAYSGPRRSDDWKFEQSDAYATFTNHDNMSGGSFDMEHHFIQGLPWIYFLGGNPYFMTAAKEDAEWLHRMVTYGAQGATIPTTWYFRAWARQAQALAIYYDFTQSIHDPENVYADDLATAFTFLIDSREDTSNLTPATSYRGRNMDRGYIYWDTSMTTDGQRILWSFFNTQIHFNAAYEALKDLDKWHYPYLRMEDFEDYLTGISQFIYKEFITCNDVIWGGKYGFEYGYRLHQTREEVVTTGTLYTEIKPYPASRPYVWLFQKTGNDYMAIANDAATWSAKNKRMSSDLQEQALYYLNIHNHIAPDRYVQLDVQNMGGGTYSLSWIVPVGAQSYQIKYSEKTIVDWLGYDRQTQSYQYDPASHIAFFAASNATGEPVPAQAGTTQNFTITGLDPTKNYHFLMKCAGQVSSLSRPTIQSISIH